MIVKRLSACLTTASNNWWSLCLGTTPQRGSEQYSEFAGKLVWKKRKVTVGAVMALRILLYWVIAVQMVTVACCAFLASYSSLERIIPGVIERVGGPGST